MATRCAIQRLDQGIQPDLAGDADENFNGNGSIMRILPLLFYLIDKPKDERFHIVRQVSAITHGHIRSAIACFYYLEFARQILLREDKFAIYKSLQTEISGFLTTQSVDIYEDALFDRLLKDNIARLPEEQIESSDYVLDTLDASIWRLLTAGKL
jgi:ADP-ribosylglycohydrolase